MKRLIFSMYTDKIEEYKTSTNDFKRNQFEKYKNLIEKSHKDYALSCKADYVLLNPKEVYYDMLQFEKIYKLEEFCNDYDEVLYLDFDVVPNKNVSFFEKNDLKEKICCHWIKQEFRDLFKSLKDLSIRTKDDNWCPMEMYIKTCVKKAMLLVENTKSTDKIANTGVIGLSKKTAELLRFKERMNHCNDVFRESLIDNLYPFELYSSWEPNNEVYFSYLIERFNIPTQKIGMQWNFMITESFNQTSDAAYLIHHVTKEFEKSFGNVESNSS